MKIPNDLVGVTNGGNVYEMTSNDSQMKNPTRTYSVTNRKQLKSKPKQAHTGQTGTVSMSVRIEIGEYGRIEWVSQLTRVSPARTSTQLNRRLIEEGERCVEACWCVYSAHVHKVYCLSGSSHSPRQWEVKCGTERLWSVRFFPDESSMTSWPPKNTLGIAQQKWKFVEIQKNILQSTQCGAIGELKKRDEWNNQTTSGYSFMCVEFDRYTTVRMFKIGFLFDWFEYNSFVIFQCFWVKQWMN